MSLSRLWRREPLHVWFHPSFRLPLTHGPGGMDARRAENVLTWLLDRRVARDATVHEAPEARWQDLRRVHDDGWLEKLDDANVVAGVLAVPPTHVPVASMLELWRRGVGATTEAVRHVLAHGGRAATLMGGFHHAGPDRGAGFCALNDIAVALAVARHAGFRGWVTVVDLDAHPPDGLGAFGLERCEIRSLGVASSWEADIDMDVRVPVGAGDREYLLALQRVLAGLRADLVIYLAGSDPLVGDELGMLGVSEAGLRERDARVFQAVGSTPCVVVPGGGYTPGSWRVLAHTLAEAAGRRAHVPEGYDPVGRRMNRVASSFPGLADEPLLTDEDVEEMFGRPTERRFLGHFTRHGVELALDRYGLLGALRGLGMGPLEVEVTTGERPERVRVYGHHGGSRHRLVDLALCVDRLAHAPLGDPKVLRVDWLELADPRGQGALPGQAFRGLGVAREIGSILVVTAERLGLAGVSFVPSHYHVAWIARHRALLLDPVQRGRFRAIGSVFGDVPLERLSERLSGDGLPTEDGEPLRWEPTPMVHALDPRLKAAIEAGEVEARAIEAGVVLRLLEPSVTFG
ncbi:MAG: histone deacetylase [Alphaproteobacteria bacterium]|nr:histone deacetylase [Alphaproteobacteria bacterium]